MCYADTATNPDGTADAFCYCGWQNTYATPAAADTAAESQQRATDDAEREYAHH